MHLNNILLIFMVIGLLGCTSTEHRVQREELEPPVTEAPLLDGVFIDQAVESEAQIFALSQAQQQKFLDYFHAPENQHIASHMRLYNYLERAIYGFDYRGETYNANVAHSRNQGNCLSLAILTTALARLAGLEVQYQKVNSAPVYQRYDRLLTLSAHVRTIVYQSDFTVPKDTLLLRRPGVVIDYFPERGNVRGDRISHADFVSMYYQNLAAQAILTERFDEAHSMLMAALDMSPHNAETLNALAVLYNQSGHSDAAYDLYEFAYQHTNKSVNLINNFAQLLEQQGNTQRAALLRENIAHIDDQNPYRWLDLGYEQLARGQLSLARKYFTRATEVAPYLHEGHFGLARTYMTLGWHSAARNSLEAAAKFGMYTPKQRLYHAKLEAMREHE